MIIAFSAWKFGGKDTAADFLIKNYGFHRLAFADPLKDITAETYGIPRKSCDDPALKEKALPGFRVDPRDAFSEMIAKHLVREFRGAEGQKPNRLVLTSEGALGIAVDENGFPDKNDLYPIFWTPRALCILEGSVKRSADSQYWVKRALSQIDPRKDYVITDLRYRSEAEQIKAKGRDLKCLTVVIRIDRFDSVDSTDSSEHDLDNYSFDYVIPNRTTVEDFQKRVYDIVMGPDL